MTITGRPKIFAPYVNLFSYYEAADALSVTDPEHNNVSLLPNLFNADRTLSAWHSTNSLKEVIIRITFPRPKSFNRLFMLDHNLLAFELEYKIKKTDSNLRSFTNVQGIDGEDFSGVSIFGNRRSNNYFEFTPVTAEYVEFSCVSNFNSDHFQIGKIFLAEELGTFRDYPTITNSLEQVQIRHKLLSGKTATVNLATNHKIKFKFRNNIYQDDLDLVQSMIYRHGPFILYVCGGSEKGKRFHNLHGWSVSDPIPVMINSRTVKLGHPKSITSNGFDVSLDFYEQVL